MKVKTLNITSQKIVKLSMPDGTEGEIVFKKLKKRDEDLEHAELKAKIDEKIAISDFEKDYFHKVVCNKLLSISGIYEDGEEVTISKVRDRDVYDQTLNLVYAAYNAVDEAQEAEQKKEQDGSAS
jgi:hypothetical protein